MSRVLVLRDREAAAETARALANRGHEALLLPLGEIAMTDVPFVRGDYSCIAVTSRNAVPALERHLGSSETETIAVGEASAERLRAAGYRVTYVGAGSAGHLVAPAARIAAQAGGRPVLLALGQERTSLLEDGLRAVGVPFAVWEAYATRPVRPTRAEAEAALGGRAPDTVLVLSVGQATGFAALAQTHPDLFRPPPRLLCLSQRIAAALPEELRAGAVISPVPDPTTLFDRLAETNLCR